MCRAKLRQFLGIALFNRSQGTAALSPELRAQSPRFVHHHTKAVDGAWRCTTYHGRSEIDSSGSGSDQKRRIDGRIEQSKLPLDTIDAAAISNIEKPILDQVPKLQNLRVGGHAEIQAAHGTENLNVVQRTNLNTSRRRFHKLPGARIR